MSSSSQATRFGLIFILRGKFPDFSIRSICDEEKETMLFRLFLSISFLILSFFNILNSYMYDACNIGRTQQRSATGRSVLVTALREDKQSWRRSTPNVALELGHTVTLIFILEGKLPHFFVRSICDDETGTMYFRPCPSISLLTLQFLIIAKLRYV